MLRQLKDNNRGIIFVTVLMVIIVMMILTVSIISLNVTQVINTDGEVRRMQAELLAGGALPFFSANQISDSANNLVIYTVPLDGILFTVVANIAGPGLAGYDNTNSLNISVTY